MQCSICYKQYVGETTQTQFPDLGFMEVSSETRDNNIAENFNLENHSSASYTVKMVGIEEDKNKR